MNRQMLRRVSRQLRQNGQRGFTLIELLVVVSILGILAAIVTMSLVGITQMANTRAKLAEKQTVQTAYDAMLADQQVPNAIACQGYNGTPQSDMYNFPLRKDPDPKKEAQVPASLYPNYLRTKETNGTYSCTGNGQINQVTWNSTR